MLIKWCCKREGYIRGEGILVGKDERTFGKRIYNVSRLLEGDQVFTLQLGQIRDEGKIVGIDEKLRTRLEKNILLG